MKKPKIITAEELKDKMDSHGNYVLVDVLSPQDFGKAHIKGAMNIPLAEIEAKGSEWLNRNMDVIVYSDGPNCNGASFAQAHLQRLGFRTWSLVGGLETWAQKGYPIDGDPNYKAHPIKQDSAVMKTTSIKKEIQKEKEVDAKKEQEQQKEQKHPFL